MQLYQQDGTTGMLLLWRASKWHVCTVHAKCGSPSPWCIASRTCHDYTSCSDKYIQHHRYIDPTDPATQCCGKHSGQTGACYENHYSRKLLCRRPKAVGLGLECRRLSLTRRLFFDAVGLGAVGVTGRRVRAKYRRVRLCCRLRLTRRPRNAVGSGHFQFFWKIRNFGKKIKKNIFCYYLFSLIFPFL
jgi:hypothetical protein